MTRSIFISIPSVEDQEIFNMVQQIFDEADNPDSIYLGISHSIPFKNKKIINEINNKINHKNISQKFINFYRNMGVGYGRKTAISMYSGQDYVLQIDGHTNFLKSWDSIVLDLYDSVPRNMQGNKYMLTAYLPGYQILENNKRHSPDDNIPRYSAFLSKNNLKLNQGLDDISIDRENSYPNIPKWLTVKSLSPPNNKNSPVLFDTFNGVENFLPEEYVYSRKINANFIFSDNKIIDDYDKIYSWNYLFLEEEFIASIEALDAGYNLIFPNYPLPLAHLYVDWYNEFYDKNSRKSVMPDNKRMEEAQKMINNYLSDPLNQEKIKKYCQYSGLTYPEFESIDTFYIPGEAL
jgi:hypothetical protein